MIQSKFVIGENGHVSNHSLVFQLGFQTDASVIDRLILNLAQP